MALIDIVIIVVFAVSAIVGYRKGFIAQAGALAAIIVAIIACRLLGPAATDMILPRGQEGETSAWTRYSAALFAYCGVYIVAYYAVVIVVKMLKLVIHTLLLGPLDSIGGAAVSVFKWFMALSVIANLYLVIWPGGKLLASSRLADGKPATWIVSLAPSVLGVLSEAFSGEETDASSTPADISPSINAEEK